MRINFDFGDLEAFLKVKESGSFFAAADQLNLSQSAVTRRVQKLEEALGTALFHRSTRSVKPTLAGKRLESRARAILEDALETTQAMQDESMAFQHQRNVVISVAAIPTVTSRILGPAIKLFLENEPLARAQILDGSANEVAEHVSQGNADFGICSLPSLDANTAFEPMFEEEIGAVLHASHELATRRYIDWEDLRGQALILPARGTGNRLLIDEARVRAKSDLVWSVETGRSTTAIDLAERTLGVALLPKSIMASTVGRDLVFRELAGTKIMRPIGFLIRSGASDTPQTKSFKEAVRSVIAS